MAAGEGGPRPLQGQTTQVTVAAVPVSFREEHGLPLGRGHPPHGDALLGGGATPGCRVGPVRPWVRSAQWVLPPHDPREPAGELGSEPRGPGKPTVTEGTRNDEPQHVLLTRPLGKDVKTFVTRFPPVHVRR